MSRLRFSLLALSSMVIVGGGVLLGSSEASAANACSNTWCSSPSTCQYRLNYQCSLSKTEVSTCVAGDCGANP